MGPYQTPMNTHAQESRTGILLVAGSALFWSFGGTIAGHALELIANLFL